MTSEGLGAPGWHPAVSRPTDDSQPRGTTANIDYDAEPVAPLSDDLTGVADQES